MNYIKFGEKLDRETKDTSGRGNNRSIGIRVPNAGSRVSEFHLDGEERVRDQKKIETVKVHWI